MKLILAICLIALAVSANAGFKEFKNKGGPTETEGSWAGWVGKSYTVGIESKDNTYVYGTQNEGEKDSAEFGKYKSFKCLGKGKFQAIVEVTSIDQDGNESKSEICEYGHIDVHDGVYKWATSDKECPKKSDYKLKRTSKFEAPFKYSCK